MLNNGLLLTISTALYVDIHVLQLLKVIDKLIEMLDNGEDIDIIYLDFAKAFNCASSETFVEARKLW